MQQVVMAAIVAFLTVLFLGPVVLPLLKRLRIGQVIRGEGPARHHAKAGVPTMGGLLFLAALGLAAALYAPRTPALSIALVIIFGFGLTGFVDDFLKVVLRRPLGLRARYKLLAQLGLGLGLALYVLEQGLGTWLQIPFTNDVIELGMFYVPFAILVVMGTTNAVNITDGLDGLAAGSSVVALAFFLLITLLQGQMELAVVAAGLAAGAAGFLFYNSHPAQVMMGDTGSLGLGGALAVLAVLTKTELLLPLVGGLFVLEIVSVILQVVYFRLTGGRRLLRMSPLHHHFELVGWSEQRVVSIFWLLAFGFAVVALFALQGF
ncbi:MAG: phospho-N-acetylmuramoyl-pentapeptide-transferase [Thermaerobacterales bacterium]